MKFTKENPPADNDYTPDAIQFREENSTSEEENSEGGEDEKDEQDEQAEQPRSAHPLANEVTPPATSEDGSHNDPAPTHVYNQ